MRILRRYTGHYEAQNKGRRLFRTKSAGVDESKLRHIFHFILPSPMSIVASIN